MSQSLLLLIFACAAPWCIRKHRFQKHRIGFYPTLIKTTAIFPRDRTQANTSIKDRILENTLAIRHITNCIISNMYITYLNVKCKTLFLRGFNPLCSLCLLQKWNTCEKIQNLTKVFITNCITSNTNLCQIFTFFTSISMW